ncbi:hypothetical protein Zmor_011790 [Zophobas morio]|uniref:Uncharacterized protein n=1 Tax=Zophobas morio TaxID=2755281 RepID=A0AA38M062_9CUCU|nr:hypothetical protein Zmor_011790 [Zophobas morio]
MQATLIIIISLKTLWAETFCDSDKVGQIFCIQDKQDEDECGVQEYFICLNDGELSDILIVDDPSKACLMGKIIEVSIECRIDYEYEELVHNSQPTESILPQPIPDEILKINNYNDDLLIHEGTIKEEKKKKGLITKKSPKFTSATPPRPSTRLDEYFDRTSPPTFNLPSKGSKMAIAKENSVRANGDNIYFILTALGVAIVIMTSIILWRRNRAIKKRSCSYKRYSKEHSITDLRTNNTYKPETTNYYNQLYSNI